MRFSSDDQRKAVFAKKKFYHGSAGFGGRIISVDGLKPASEQKRTNRGYGQKSDPDYVYLTSDKGVAKTYADANVSYFNDDEFGPVVYEVEMEEGDLEPDIEFPSSFKYKGGIPSERLKRVKKFSEEPHEEKRIGARELDKVFIRTFSNVDIDGKAVGFRYKLRSDPFGDKGFYTREEAEKIFKKMVEEKVTK